MAEVLTGEERQRFVDVLALWSQQAFPDDPVSWEGRVDFLPEMTAREIKYELYRHACIPNSEIKRLRKRGKPTASNGISTTTWPTINGRVYYFETRLDSADQSNQ